MSKRLLDLFCGAGGAGQGYADAEFTVVGVDSAAQKRYPFEFHCADAFAFLEKHGREFDVIHASPPCQAYSATQHCTKATHPALIPQVREMLRRLGRPYVIENVVGAPLIDPITLCGAMFDLRVYRHRIFEVSQPIAVPAHPAHTAPLRKMGRPVRPGEFIHVVGNFSGVQLARDAMGIQWMVRDELAQAIPPAYTEWIGRHLRVNP